MVAAMRLPASAESVAALPPEQLIELVFRCNMPKVEENASVIHELSLAGQYRHRYLDEFLQNAEDVEAPSCTFEIASDRLVVENTGRPFEHKDAYSISSFLRSAKTATDNNRQIGRFGVGFKSVFAISDCPEIHSRDGDAPPFAFQLPAPKKLNWKRALELNQQSALDFPHGLTEKGKVELLKKKAGFVLPEVIGLDRETPRRGTRFVLPFKRGISFEDILPHRELDSLAMGLHCLLFLENLSQVTICGPALGASHSWKRVPEDELTIPRAGAGRVPETAHRFRLEQNGGAPEQWLRYSLGPIPVPEGQLLALDEELRRRVTSTGVTINLAVGLRQYDLSPVGLNLDDLQSKPAGRIFVYLPVGTLQSGLAFHVEAPFNLTLTRDSLPDDTYNRWLRGEIQIAVDRFFKFLCSSPFSHRAYTLVPRAGWTSDTLPEALEEARSVPERLACLPDTGDNLHLADNLMYVSRSMEAADAVASAAQRSENFPQYGGIIGPRDAHLVQLCKDETLTQLDTTMAGRLVGFSGEGQRLLNELGGAFYSLAVDVLSGLEAPDGPLRNLPVPTLNGRIIPLRNGHWLEQWRPFENELGSPWACTPPDGNPLIDPRLLGPLEDAYGEDLGDVLPHFQRSNAGSKLKQVAQIYLESTDDLSHPGYLSALEFLRAGDPPPSLRVRCDVKGRQEIFSLDTLARWPRETSGSPWQQVPYALLRCAPSLSAEIYPPPVHDWLENSLPEYTWKNVQDALSLMEKPAPEVLMWLLSHAEVADDPDEAHGIREAMLQFPLPAVGGGQAPLAQLVDLPDDLSPGPWLEALLQRRRVVDWEALEALPHGNAPGFKMRLRNCHLAPARLRLSEQELAEALERAEAGANPVEERVALERLTEVGLLVHEESPASPGGFQSPHLARLAVLTLGDSSGGQPLKGPKKKRVRAAYASLVESNLPAPWFEPGQRAVLANGGTLVPLGAPVLVGNTPAIRGALSGSELLLDRKAAELGPAITDGLGLLDEGEVSWRVSGDVAESSREVTSSAREKLESKVKLELSRTARANIRSKLTVECLDATGECLAEARAAWWSASPPPLETLDLDEALAGKVFDDRRKLRPLTREEADARKEVRRLELIMRRRLVETYSFHVADTRFRELYEETTRNGVSDEAYSKCLEHVSMERLVARLVHQQGYDWETIPRELTQNIEDAYRTVPDPRPPTGQRSMSFQFEPDRLLVEHGGRHFNQKDRKDNPRNDIEAICSMATQKGPDDGEIGHFGRGFKSVFDLCHAPEIHTPPYHFKIQSMAIPEWLAPPAGVAPEENGHTRFIFKVSGRERRKRLEQLQSRLRKQQTLGPNWLVFLDQLAEFQLHFSDGTGWIYRRTRIPIETGMFAGGTIVSIEQRRQAGQRTEVESLYFLRLDSEERDVAMAVRIEPDTRLPLPVVESRLRVYLPTEVEAGVKFLVHGQFETEPGRNQLKAESPHNQTLARKLGELAGHYIEEMLLSNQDDVRALERLLPILPLGESTGGNLLAPLEGALAGLIEADRHALFSVTGRALTWKEARRASELQLDLYHAGGGSAQTNLPIAHPDLVEALSPWKRRLQELRSEELLDMLAEDPEQPYDHLLGLVLGLIFRPTSDNRTYAVQARQGLIKAFAKRPCLPTGAGNMGCPGDLYAPWLEHIVGQERTADKSWLDARQLSAEQRKVAFAELGLRTLLTAEDLEMLLAGLDGGSGPDRIRQAKALLRHLGGEESWPRYMPVLDREALERLRKLAWLPCKQGDRLVRADRLPEADRRFWRDAAALHESFVLALGWSKTAADAQPEASQNAQKLLEYWQDRREKHIGKYCLQHALGRYIGLPASEERAREELAAIADRGDGANRLFYRLLCLATVQQVYHRDNAGLRFLVETPVSQMLDTIWETGGDWQTLKDELALYHRHPGQAVAGYKDYTEYWRRVFDFIKIRFLVNNQHLLLGFLVTGRNAPGETVRYLYRGTGGLPALPEAHDVIHQGLGQTLKSQAFFVCRELQRAGVFPTLRLAPLCYTPGSQVRRAAYALGFLDTLPGDSPCIEEYEEVSERLFGIFDSALGDGTCNNDYDIPLLHLARTYFSKSEVSRANRQRLEQLGFSCRYEED